MDKETKKPKKIEDYNSLYDDANSADQSIFAEQRSNILLVSGDHYQKRTSKFYTRIRDSKEIPEQQKLRLTKNHIQKITKSYINNILSYAPGVRITARAEKELRDQKCAELNQAVWSDAKRIYNLEEKTQQFCKDFVEIGECGVKIMFDPDQGDIKGYQQKVDENGQPMHDEQGQMIPDEEQPIRAGKFVFERFFGMNALRAPEAKSWRESRVIIIRKMMSTKDLLSKYGQDEEKKKFVTEDQDDTFLVFDGNQASYNRTKNQSMIREFYFRPCAEYPKGWFCFNTKAGILEEGELPGGIFPLVVETFDEIQTTPRGRSIIKQLRPYQAEINRAASKIAEHHITLGDDKLIVMNGSKITQAGVLPGVRGISVSGIPPTILPGRDGSQYLPYMQAQISEMYQVANSDEDAQDKQDTQADPYTLLFRAIRNKKKYMIYAAKFERFQREYCDVFLQLAKMYYTDDMLIPAIGRAEQINITEFRGTAPHATQIELEPMSDDIDTQMGKQLMINHVIQYAGAQLGKDDIGKLVRNSPYGNMDQSWDDLTLDYDNSVNMILALDRGEQFQANPADKPEYMISKIINRQRKSDYKLLPPQIQQAYDGVLQTFEKIKSDQAQAMQRAQSGFIPMDGYMVVCDLYVPDKKDPSKTSRVKIPESALSWLIKKLEDQGASQAQLSSMNQKAMSDIANMIMTGQQPQAAPQMGGAA